MKRGMETRIVLLAGNPNVGKSTVFNNLTGLKQHTGNWAGKTVETAEGSYDYGNCRYRLVDLPGSYSLDARSREEQVAREALEQWDCACIVVVCDATMLQRNLIQVYQILALGRPVVVCVNLMDQARRKGLQVDTHRLSEALGVPVVGTSASRKQGLAELRAAVRWAAEHPSAAQIGDMTRRQRAELADWTTKMVTTRTAKRDHALAWDRILTGKYTGLPILLLLLFFLLWLTIAGANVPSQLLWNGVCRAYTWLNQAAAGLPWWLRGALVDGVFLTTGRVVAVMLPPMAIFFPLFTLLEDLGYLPRMAYNLDSPLERAGCCGKMALSMCMGLGCNASGVVGCRIIDSPRERLLGILTNSMIPCNGRFGALILLLTACIAPQWGGAGAALGLLGFLVLAVLMTMGLCKLLSLTLLRGIPSAFTLELPPFRIPRVGQVLIRSVLDRTLKILCRAVVVAAPAGLLLWILQTVTIGDVSLLRHLSDFLDPIGTALGMRGVLLAGFLLGFPANEIVLPVAMLAATGTMELEPTAMGIGALHLSWEMALCTALFFLFHWPCATTCLTIHRETGSLRWTILAMVLPTMVGGALCFAVHALLG